ncbi:MAG: hypothetical protein HQ583_06840 [Candidatus Abyssubacteria bacterium]|nr:hypothetical protein [Candidatus Abyssubacteria bacterium]
MTAGFGFMPLSNGRSELLVREIMGTIHLDRAEATSMALRMLIAQLFIAASVSAFPLEEVQGVA